MVVITVDGYLDAGSHEDHTFRARQAVVYNVEEVPSDGLLWTDLAIEVSGWCWSNISEFGGSEGGQRRCSLAAGNLSARSHRQRVKYRCCG